jgi:hypothetical protein
MYIIAQMIYHKESAAIRRRRRRNRVLPSGEGDVIRGSYPL